MLAPPNQDHDEQGTPRLFIGMPVYNGARFLREALDSLSEQSNHDWKLLISDNASTDGTEEICREYSQKDRRIRYYRQERNIGAVANFKFLLDRADAPCFMWAAADDRWHPDFISSCMKLLAEHLDAGSAFTNLVVIDPAGLVVRPIPSLEQFSGAPTPERIRSFLRDPEINGKACLIYGIFRTDLSREAWEAVPDMAVWGSDYQFVLAALVRRGVRITPEVRFFKRYVGDGGLPYPSPDMINHPERYIFPLSRGYRYISGTISVARGTPFFWLTAGTMLSRLPRSLFNFFLDLGNAFFTGEENSE